MTDIRSLRECDPQAAVGGDVVSNAVGSTPSAAHAPDARSPLAGVRVLELGSVAMAPYAGQWLGDLGADVIKVEAPGGDTTRKVGPSTEAGMGALFLGLNRNKRSIELDLKTGSGRAALMRIADGVDVFLHNNRQHKMDALGLGPTPLLERNPRLIYAALQGFGAGGAYSGRPAYDDVIQSMCGLAAIMAGADGQPRYVPTVLADKTTGLIGAIAILAALQKRTSTGHGGLVEIPMFESMVSFTAVEHLYGKQFVPPVGHSVYPRTTAPGRRPYRTKNGYLAVLPYSDRQWRDFLTAAGREDLTVDARLANMSSRTTHIAELYDLLAEIILTATTEHWIEICTEAQVPHASVLSLDDLLDDPHLEQTGYFEGLEDPGLGRLRLPGIPVRFSGLRPVLKCPPRLGQHTKEILDEAGFTAEEIAKVML